MEIRAQLGLVSAFKRQTGRLQVAAAASIRETVSAEDDRAQNEKIRYGGDLSDAKSIDAMRPTDKTVIQSLKMNTALNNQAISFMRENNNVPLGRIVDITV